MGRYDRQLGLIGREGQNRLSEAQVLIVGAGGIGNIAAKYLASSGVGYIEIMDKDKIEKSNLNRQILFNESSINKAKATSLVNTLKKINPDIKYHAEEGEFNNLWNVEALDLVLDCTDNLETSYILEKKCLENGIPLIFAKTSKYFGVVTIIKDRPYLKKNYPTKQLNKYKSAIPAIGGLVGSFQANLAIKLLLGLKTNDKVFHFDILNDNFVQFDKV